MPMPLAGILACILLLSAAAIMEHFWRKSMPDHSACIMSAQAGQHTMEQQQEAAVLQVIQGQLAQLLCIHI
jgi:hypothetical protein